MRIFFTCGGVIESCNTFNLNGSFVHGSCPDGATVITSIKYNYSDGVCLIPVEINGHNEGWFTYSNAVTGFIVENNFSYNGGESCWGAQGLDDYNNTFSNNYFNSFLKKKFATTNGHAALDDISNYTYINVPE